jgi:two-component system response regulator DevR
MGRINNIACVQADSAAVRSSQGNAQTRRTTPQIPIFSRFARALVVDDDDALRRGLARLLRTGSVEVCEAKSVAEGLKLLAGEPDLVITDVRLPDGSGLDLVERASLQQPTPVIVAISGLASAREAFVLALAGARLYLTKPFAERELIDGIADLFRCSGSRSLPALVGRDLRENLVSFAERFSIPEREMELARLVTEGVPRALCADRLEITENTCKTLTRRLLQRCGARSLAQVPRLVLNPDAPRR